ncbi:MAG: type 1 glutamine amidotransferase [Pseudomonadota bacterium]
MIKLLVVDSNTREVNAEFRRHFGRAVGEDYAAVIERLDANVSVDIVRPYDGDAVPALAPFAGMVFTGSGVDWNVDDARARVLHQAMEAGFHQGLSVFGSCNGMQLAAVVLGGACEASPNGREYGIARDLQLTPEGANHPMMANRHSGFSALCVHRDEVTRLPVGAVLLASNAHSAVQAFSYSVSDTQFWGTQYHPEFAPGPLSDYLVSRQRMPRDAAADLTAAETSAVAASRLGLTSQALSFEQRTLEIRNWLRQLS